MAESPEEKSERLPFEPTGSRKKQPKRPPAPLQSAPDRSIKAEASADAKPESMQIPQVVSQRMARRMAFFCGIPSALGMATFFVSYFLVTKNIFPLPTSAVVLVSMGFFGLGVLGLSYGVISASWDEEVAGSLWGWSEFTLNWSHLTAAWRSNKKSS
ncbi:PAM68 family protein [Microcoleus sp. FACHB-1515]|uniref:PAM68 family protein n=1 Tax=Cyanophyceae TaxID=3028117 RepID=UPI001684AB1F|nr:PAM68 family protein [Microcoleus sp. FACHB-1515]MBD2090585.1 PAM68 family protein [Microcoleus sp. FACHB-1515]